MGEQITQGLIVCDVKKQKKHHRHRVIHNQKNNTLGRVHMKKFTKLALAASVALSANAMAMQAMDDSMLSATTGQDGISIGIGISKVEIEKLFIHDNDGLSENANNNIIGTTMTDVLAGNAGVQVGGDRPIKGGTATPGAIVIKANGKGATAEHGLVITANNDALLDTHNLLDLKIDSDAGEGTNGAFLNIAAQVSGLTINIGEIGVTASGTQGAAVNSDGTVSASAIRRGGDDNNYNAILSGLTLKTGQMAANVQVGAAPQGAMIKLNTTMIGGLEIAELGLLDNSTKTLNASGDVTRAAGEIFFEIIKVSDANSKDLTINQDISVFSTGSASANGFIQITSHSGATDTYIKSIKLGSQAAASIGDVEIQGLQTYNTLGAPGAIITITGH